MDPIELIVSVPETVALGARPSPPVRLDVGAQEAPGDYERLANKPSIEGVTLQGDKLLSDFGERALSNMEIKQAFDRVFGGN